MNKTMKTSEAVKTKEKEKDVLRQGVIASRKTCDAEGTGLSHYILMDKKGG